MGLRLPMGAVTVLLGTETARHGVLRALDETTARCAASHGSVVVERLTADAADEVASRLDAVERAGRGEAAIVLVDRMTEGLGAAERRTVLSAVRGLARPGRAVLVDDPDPVAALAVADTVLRAYPCGRLALEAVGGVASLTDGYLAS